MQISSPTLNCQVGWFFNPTTGEASPAPCKKLSCEACAPGRLRQYAARLGTHTWLRFLTITLPAAPAYLKDSLARIRHGWRVVRQWLKRRGMEHYTWCLEATQTRSERPHLHMHVLMDGAYIPTALSHDIGRAGTLNDALVRAGLGGVFKLSKVRGGLSANAYVTKYLSKSTVRLPRYARRVQTTIRALPRVPSADSGQWRFVARNEMHFHLPPMPIRAPEFACANGCVEVCRVANHQPGQAALNVLDPLTRFSRKKSFRTLVVQLEEEAIWRKSDANDDSS